MPRPAATAPPARPGRSTAAARRVGGSPAVGGRRAASVASLARVDLLEGRAWRASRLGGELESVLERQRPCHRSRLAQPALTRERRQRAKRTLSRGTRALRPRRVERPRQNGILRRRRDVRHLARRRRAPPRLWQRGCRRMVGESGGLRLSHPSGEAQPLILQHEELLANEQCVLKVPTRDGAWVESVAKSVHLCRARAKSRAGERRLHRRVWLTLARLIRGGGGGGAAGHVVGGGRASARAVYPCAAPHSLCALPLHSVRVTGDAIAARHGGSAGIVAIGRRS